MWRRKNSGHPSVKPTLQLHLLLNNIVLEVVFLLMLLTLAQGIGIQRRDINSKVDKKMQERCKVFSEPNIETREFFSPFYPGNYTNGTECVLTIRAEYGYVIRIDFRDYFKLEPSTNCENDFLEIRDGAHGYSDLIGRFCGTKFPPIITSKDRDIWLRFRSDESLEYLGFKAVYEYIKSPEVMRPEIDNCYLNVHGVEGLISNEHIPQDFINYSRKYKEVPIDCTWTIRVAHKRKIYLFFENFKLKEPNECDLNFVDIFRETRDLSNRMKHFCGSVADSVVTTGNIMYFRYFAINKGLDSKFRAWFTAFRERVPKNESDVCQPDEYDCDDATCIDRSLQCNQIKNCRHHYDEEGCNNSKLLKFNIQSQHIIIILTLGCGLLGGMCFAMCFNCVKKLIRDGRQIHENIRRSREQLEERSRSISTASSPRAVHRPPNLTDDDPCYIGEAKTNGRPCLHPAEDDEDSEDIDDEEEDDDDDELDDEEEEESCVEMRDCECQTRDSLLTQRDSVGLHHQGLPLTPPPPPTRRPPGLPPLSHPLVPSPPPPPASHYPRPPSNHYGGSYGSPPVSRQSQRDHYEVNDPNEEDPYNNQRYRAEAVIEMRDRPGQYEPTKTGKTTPDVLVTH